MRIWTEWWSWVQPLRAACSRSRSFLWLLAALAGISDIRPDRVADGRLSSERSRKRWYDTSAFRRVSCNIPNRPDLCHFGNSGCNILNAPGQRNLDFALFKNFELQSRREDDRAVPV